MKFTRFVKRTDVPKLEYEVISQELRTYLTRELRRRVDIIPADGDYKTLKENQLINRARTLVGFPPYKIQYWDKDEFYVEQSWHDQEFHFIFRRFNTVQFIEFVCELIEREYFTVDFINELLERDSASFRIQASTGEDEFGNDSLMLSVEVMDITTLEDASNSYEHPNIRLLLHRADLLLGEEDFAGVLHTVATVFETLAKDIVGIPAIQDKSLGNFFDRYRNDSLLPPSVLDFILEVYTKRNTEPLAGHGSLEPSTLSHESAVILLEMTKAFVKIEYMLRLRRNGKVRDDDLLELPP